MKTRLGALAVITFTLLLGAAAGFAQTIPGLDDVRKGLDMISVQKLLEGKPALTTSLEDAVTEVAFLDGFEPLDWAPLSLQPRAAGGEFRVAGGAYAMEVESYCLRAGGYAPGRGDGYLHAPAKGARAAVVRNILHRAQAHPQIEQQQIQVLLWAILSRSKVSDMSGDLLATAKALLTPEEIYQVNGGALGLVPSEVLDQAVRKAPPLLGEALEAEAKVRGLLSEGDATYGEIERAAVLTGEAPVGEGSREVPWGRWSYHPAGYFIRYMPHGYSQTVVWVYAPERFTVETDSLGRLTLVAGPGGWRLGLDYGDATPAVVAAEPGLTVQRIHSVSMELNVDQPQRVTLPMDAWQVEGWVLLDAAPGGAPATVPASELPGLAERSRRAADHRQVVERLCDVTSASPSGSKLQRIAALANLRMALQDLALGSSDAPPTFDPVEFVTRAWASELGRALVGRPSGAGQHASTSSWSPRTVAPSPKGSGDFVLASWVVPAAAQAQEEVSDEDYYTMDLSDGVSQPGNTARQRVGISNRGTRRNDECAGAYAACTNSALVDFADGQVSCDAAAGEFSNVNSPSHWECSRGVSRQHSRDLQDCATIARHCLGL